MKRDNANTGFTPRVLILGGGFAGLAAARALGSAVRQGRCRVTLLDHSACTTMIPALPDYAAGLLPEHRISVPIARRIPAGVESRQAAVTAVDLAARQVQTTSGPEPYDFLILALGSVARTDTSIPPPDTSFPLATRSDADPIRAAFPDYLATAKNPHVLISGAGYTGIELAVSLARRARQAQAGVAITLVDSQSDILPFLAPRQHARVLRCLDRQQVALRLDCRITHAGEGGVTLSDGTRFQGVMRCRTEGTCAPITPTGEGLNPLADGRLPVTAALYLPTYPEVYAAGDAAAIAQGNGYLRKAVNFAIYSGNRAGRNVARRLEGRVPVPFHPIDLGWVIPLGDDSVGRVFGGLPLQGKAGLCLHYVMCGYRNYSLRNFSFFAAHGVTTGWEAKRKER